MSDLILPKTDEETLILPDHLKPKKIEQDKHTLAKLIRTCGQHKSPLSLSMKADIYHANFIKYLEYAWSNHLGIVIWPDIFWNTLLCELTTLVKADVEGYRHIFSSSADKQTITVFTDNPIDIPLDVLTEALKAYVPSDVNVFLPQFGTSTENSLHAFYATFADMCSPYYEYCTTSCGFSTVTIRGSEEDWLMIADRIQPLIDYFPNEIEYLSRFGNTILTLMDNISNKDFWKQMFSIRWCGSGGDAVEGWINRIFKDRPGHIDQFPSHLSEVKYTYEPDNCKYIMKSGLLGSQLQDGILVPDFGYMIWRDNG